MSVIPINPSSLLNCGAYQPPTAPIPTSIRSQKHIGGERDAFLPMQLAFSKYTSWSIDLGSINPVTPFSRIGSMYVDTTNSEHDVNILFPDTGFEFRVPFGDCAMIPILTNNAQQKFFVILDSGNQTSSTDLVNIVVNNFFLPAALTSEYQRTVAYGYGQMFELLPTLTQSTAFLGELQSPSVTSVTLINASQWYITSIFISGEFIFTAGNGIGVQLLDDGVPFYISAVGTATADQLNYPQMISLSGLNYVSSGSGPLVLNFNQAPADVNLSGWSVFCTIGGGVLVT